VPASTVNVEVPGAPGVKINFGTIATSGAAKATGTGLAAPSLPIGIC
jgi:hypothetical protein